jgi:sporulation protein YlmC with PRC-barrel domain
MKLDLGNHVFSSDGRNVGKVDRIILETSHMTVREFVVHKGFLFGHDRFITTKLVDRIDENGDVHLTVPFEQAQELPEFVKDQHYPVIVGEGNPGARVVIMSRPGSIPKDAVVLSHRTEAYDSNDHYLGYLDKVEYDENARVTHIIVEAGSMMLTTLRVPVAVIGTVRHDRITLREPVGAEEVPVPLT